MELYSQPRSTPVNKVTFRDLPPPPPSQPQYESPRPESCPYTGPDPAMPGADVLGTHTYVDMRQITGEVGSFASIAQRQSSQRAANPIYMDQEEPGYVLNKQKDRSSSTRYLYANQQPALAVADIGQQKYKGCSYGRMKMLAIIIALLLSVSLSAAALCVTLLRGHGTGTDHPESGIEGSKVLHAKLAQQESIIDRLNQTLAAEQPTTSTVAQLLCPDDYALDPYSEQCIRLITMKKTWADARDHCISVGETMATFTTKRSVEWLYRLITDRKSSDWGSRSIYIGLYHDDTDWKWAGLEDVAVSQAIWAPGEPDDSSKGSCGCMKYGHLPLVYDCICDERDRYSICQTPAMSN